MGQGIAIGLEGWRKNASLFHIGISLNRIIVEGTPVTGLVLLCQSWSFGEQYW